MMTPRSAASLHPPRPAPIQQWCGCRLLNAAHAASSGTGSLAVEQIVPIIDLGPVVRMGEHGSRQAVQCSARSFIRNRQPRRGESSADY